MLNLNNKLCIFDCDGTLVDTEPLIAKSWSIFFKKYYNIDLKETEYFENCHGGSPKHIAEFFKQKLGFALEYKGEIEKNKRAITQELIRNELEPITGVDEFLKEIKDIRKCITSNSSKEKLLLSIRKVGLDHHFNENEIFSRDLVKNGIVKNAKPAPDIYLHTAEQMGYKPKKCIVFEDSITGIQAGKSANMMVIGCITPSCWNKSDMRKKMEKAKADYIVENMMEILNFNK